MENGNIPFEIEKKQWVIFLPFFLREREREKGSRASTLEKNILTVTLFFRHHYNDHSHALLLTKYKAKPSQVSTVTDCE